MLDGSKPILEWLSKVGLEHGMPETDCNALVAQILSSYLSNNTVAADALPAVIESVKRAFCGPGQTPPMRTDTALSNNVSSGLVAIPPEDYAMLRQTVKYFGYQLAIQLAADLPIRNGLERARIGLNWKPSTQEDLESDWVAYWLGELKLPVIFHRKLWEYAYVLQAVYEHGLLRPGTRALGFGCGEEPIASYLASQGVDTLVTDLETEIAKSAGWLDSNEHSSTLESSFKKDLVDRPIFDKHVKHRFVDMNSIPSDLVGYDFCWSICSMEHLGSTRHGLDFVINTMKTLRSGGVSVHTTEFNFNNDEQTVDNNPQCVLFQKKHFAQLAEELTNRGYEVFPLDFFVGNKPLDSFIDIPPYGSHWPEGQSAEQSIVTAHIKSAVAGFASTCFGIIAKVP